MLVLVVDARRGRPQIQREIKSKEVVVNRCRCEGELLGLLRRAETESF